MKLSIEEGERLHCKWQDLVLPRMLRLLRAVSSGTTSEKHFFWLSYIHWVLSKTRGSYYWELVTLRVLWRLCFCCVDDKTCLLCEWYIGFYHMVMSVSYWISLKREKASWIHDVTFGYMSLAWPSSVFYRLCSSVSKLMKKMQGHVGT